MHVRVIIFIMFAMGAIVPLLPLLFGTREFEWIHRLLRVMNPVTMLEIASRTSNNDIATSEYIVLGIAAGMGLLLNARTTLIGVLEVLTQPVSPTSKTKTQDTALAEQTA
jgi:hypothetical protein